MSETNLMTVFALQVHTYFWVTIWYKYHDLQYVGVSIYNEKIETINKIKSVEEIFLMKLQNCIFLRSDFVW